MITDGVIESRNVEGEQLGSSRLMEILQKVQSKDNPIMEIMDEVNGFTGGKYEDDISLISIKAE